VKIPFAMLIMPFFLHQDMLSALVVVSMLLGISNTHSCSACFGMVAVTRCRVHGVTSASGVCQQFHQARIALVPRVKEWLG
jgi:hypothetical protein